MLQQNGIVIRGKTERRLAERAKIVLLVDEGRSSEQIAEQLDTLLARVSKWRQRFRKGSLAGLTDAARPGKPGHGDRQITSPQTTAG